MIFAIFNQKGGVAKTTTAVNLSTSLAILGKRVLLIDFDSQAHSTIGFGINPKEVKSAYEFILNSDKGSIYNTKIERLDIICASSDLSGARIELVNMRDREFFLKESINKVKDNYDYIIIDTSPSLCLLSINVLVACDRIMIPMQCDYYSLEGLSQIVNTIEEVKVSFNNDLEIDGILLTMCDFRNLLSRQVKDDVQGHFGELVYKTVIPRNIKLSEAPSFGMPVYMHDKSSKGSIAYLDLANELINRE